MNILKQLGKIKHNNSHSKIKKKMIKMLQEHIKKKLIVVQAEKQKFYNSLYE